MTTPIGITLIAGAKMFPAFFAITPNRTDWEVDDSLFGPGRYSVQANVPGPDGSLCQGVVWVDENKKTLEWFVVVVSKDQHVLWASKSKEIPYFPLFQSMGDGIEINFSERDSDGTLGVLLDVYHGDSQTTNQAVFSDAVLFPPELQPSMMMFGAGIIGFGNGSSANFKNASFHYRVNENGISKDSLAIFGGGNSGEQNNLGADPLSSSEWQSPGAEIDGDFVSPDTVPTTPDT